MRTHGTLLVFVSGTGAMARWSPTVLSHFFGSTGQTQGSEAVHVCTMRSATGMQERMHLAEPMQFFFAIWSVGPWQQKG